MEGILQEYGTVQSRGRVFIAKTQERFGGAVYNCAMCGKALGRGFVKFVLPSKAFGIEIMPLDQRVVCASCHLETQKAEASAPVKDNLAGEDELIVAIRAGDNSWAKKSLESGCSPNSISAGGYGALHLSTIFGNSEITETLLKNGAAVNMKTEGIGFTPLHFAAFYGYEKITRMLLDSGADVNSEDNFGRTPLRIATSRKQEAIRELLIEAN
jgi:hypothetical protein